MNVPDDLHYTEEHEWARSRGDAFQVGITDYAQDALGDIVFVQLPQVGAQVAAGDQLGEVESTKSVSDLYAPVSGTVTSVNPKLEESPQLLNDDPYGEGWICVIEPGDASTVGALLDAYGYRKLIGS